MSKIILKVPLSSNADLPTFIRQCLTNGIQLISIWGPDATSTEDQIDWLIVEETSEAKYSIVTTSHEDESLEEVIAFTDSFKTSTNTPARIVEL